MYQDLRSLGTAESCWKTLEFPMYSRYPAVERLDIHLDGEQNCQFEDGDERQVVEAGPPQTSLTAWFETIKEGSQTAAAREAIEPSAFIRGWSVTYPDFVERYRFQKHRGVCSWTLRKRGCGDGSVIGRIRNVHPAEGALFYLRLLLHHVPAKDLSLSYLADDVIRSNDAFSFEALKYASGVKQETYKAACCVRG